MKLKRKNLVYFMYIFSATISFCLRNIHFYCFVSDLDKLVILWKNTSLRDKFQLFSQYVEGTKCHVMFIRAYQTWHHARSLSKNLR